MSKWLCDKLREVDMGNFVPGRVSTPYFSQSQIEAGAHRVFIEVSKKEDPNSLFRISTSWSMKDIQFYLDRGFRLYLRETRTGGLEIDLTDK